MAVDVKGSVVTGIKYNINKSGEYYKNIENAQNNILIAKSLVDIAQYNINIAYNEFIIAQQEYQRNPTPENLVKLNAAKAEYYTAQKKYADAYEYLDRYETILKELHMDDFFREVDKYTQAAKANMDFAKAEYDKNKTNKNYIKYLDTKAKYESAKVNARIEVPYWVPIKKIMYKGTLVFTAAFFTKILVRLSSRLVNGKKNIPNAAWAVWEEERVRLSNIVTQNKNAYDRAAAAAKPYEDALKNAQQSKDRWLASHPKPDEQRETAAHKQWQTRLDTLNGQLADAAGKVNAALTKWNKAVADYNARVNEVNAAASAYESAVKAFNAAVKARDEHKAKEPSKTITVTKKNPDWTTWNTTKAQYDRAVESAKGAYDAANSVLTGLVADTNAAYQEYLYGTISYDEYLAVKKRQDDYKSGYYKEKLDAYNAAKSNRDTWLASNPEPPKTITVTEDNPEWAKWEEKRKELQQKVNSTYADMNSKEAEAKRLKSAWDSDEPTYAQNIHNAENEYDQWKASYDWINNVLTEHKAKEPTKYETNPAYTQWLNNKRPYDDAVSNASSALAPYASAKENAYNALISAQSDYNTHYNKQPPKRIDVDCKYYYYDLSVSMKDKPKLPQDESKSVLNIKLKINNPQTEADRQDAHFINVNRGPNPAYLNTSLDVHNTSRSVSTSWASMDMIYPNAEIVFTTSSGFTKTYPIDLNKDFTTDDFAFEY